MNANDQLRMLIAQAIKPHAPRIAEHMADNNIVVFLLEAAAIARQAAESVGWNGKDTWFVLSSEKRTWLAERAGNDDIFRRWLEREDGDGRIFLFIHEGSILLNVGSEGYYVEPGSTDYDSVRAKVNTQGGAA